MRKNHTPAYPESKCRLWASELSDQKNFIQVQAELLNLLTLTFSEVSVKTTWFLKLWWQDGESWILIIPTEMVLGNWKIEAVDMSSECGSPVDVEPVISEL